MTLQETLNIIRDYKDLMYRVTQYERAIERGFRGLVQDKTLPLEERDENGNAIVRELGEELTHRVLGKLLALD